MATVHDIPGSLLGLAVHIWGRCILERKGEDDTWQRNIPQTQ
jgi:hypothetical protein